MVGDLLINLLASVIFAIIVLIFFDTDKLKAFLSKILPFTFYKTFERVSKREHVLKCFRELFINYSYEHGGKILLMSNTGGYPEYNPYTRIIELAMNDNITIYLAVSRVSFREFSQRNQRIANEIVRNDKIKIFIFDNLTPYKFRIGINTDIKTGFFCAYHGHNSDTVNLEGIRTNNPVLLEALEQLYMGLLSNGEELTLKNSEEFL